MPEWTETGATSAFGPSRPSHDVRFCAAVGGQADIKHARAAFHDFMSTRPNTHVVTDPTRRANHLRDFNFAELRGHNKQACESLRLTADSARIFNALLTVQMVRQKYSASSFRKMMFFFRDPASMVRGVSRSSRT
jgi:hypothetical protein